MLFKEIIAIYTENNANTLMQNVDLLTVKQVVHMFTIEIFKS
jgi:hypothetical protein